MYYRHIYSKLNPNLAQRMESWQNYCDLFELLLGASVKFIRAYAHSCGHQSRA